MLRLIYVIYPWWDGNKYKEIDRKIKLAMRLVDLYRPYVLFKGLYVSISKFQLMAFDIYNFNLHFKVNFSYFDARFFSFFFFCRFDDTNTEILRLKRKEINKELYDLFDFDPKSIDWDDYMTTIHIPGLITYVLKK